MSLLFAGPNEGWELSCDECYETMFMREWDDASNLVLRAEGDGWELEEYAKWDGVTYADAKCHVCLEGDDV